MADFFDLSIEEQNIVLILEPTLRKTEKVIIGPEGCSPEDAELPFDSVLDRVTGNDPNVTDYIFIYSQPCVGRPSAHNPWTGSYGLR